MSSTKHTSVLLSAIAVESDSDDFSNLELEAYILGFNKAREVYKVDDITNLMYICDKLNNVDRYDNDYEDKLSEELITELIKLIDYYVSLNIFKDD